MTDEDESRGFFPGSRTPLPTAEKPSQKTEQVRPTGIWDTRPTQKVINGETVDFFSIGAVCLALGRPAVTIRLWIRDGHLPAATYRMPDRNEIKGRRLYTRAQVEQLVKVAEAHGILGATRVIWKEHPTFADDVRAAWDSVR